MSMPAETRPRHTVNEYLAMEEKALDRHEYRDGEVLAMAGGTENHSLITANVIRILGNLLDGKPCRAYDSNLRVAIPRKTLYTYPDVTVVCGPSIHDPKDATNGTVSNPRLIVEVLSDSTEAFDRGDKFTRYRTIESFQEYVLIGQKTPSIEVYFRQEDGTWLLTPAMGIEAQVRLRSLQLDLALAKVYAKVEFPPTVEAPADSQGGSI